MEENYLPVDETIEIWVDDMLEFYGVDSEEDLTIEQLKSEISDEEDTLKDERMWNIGNNVEVHETYLAYLQELLSKKQEELE